MVRDDGLHKKKSKSCVRDAATQPHLKDVSVCRVSAEHPHYPASAHKCLPGCVYRGIFGYRLDGSYLSYERRFVGNLSATTNTELAIQS